MRSEMGTENTNGLPQNFFKSRKEIYIAAGIAAVIALFWLGIWGYNAKKVSDFSYRISKAEKPDDFRAIVEGGCPSALLPQAEFFLAKALFEQKDYAGAFEHFKRFVNLYPDNFLFGRAVIGYIQAGFQTEKKSEFLDEAAALVQGKTFSWKNEALYSIGLLYEQSGQKQKAQAVYKIITDSGDAQWKDDAGWKLSELSKTR